MPQAKNDTAPKASLGKRKRSRAPALPASRGSESPSPKEEQPTLEEEGDDKEDDAATRRNDKNEQKAKQTRTSKAKATRKQKSAPPDPSTWPPYLIHLERTHRALNLVSTFLAARRQAVPPTLETLRPAVEQHTRVPLVVEDVAAVVALCALRGGCGGGGSSSSSSSDGNGKGNGENASGGVGGVRFEFVDEAALAVSLGAEGGEYQEYEGGERTGEKREVLVFEFLDGELRSERTGAGAAAESKMRMPSFGQAQIKRLIERRNGRFVQAAGELVERCRAEGVEPEVVLRREREKYIPRPTPTQTQAEGGGQRRLGESLPENIPRERKSIPEIVRELKESSWYTGQIVPDGHRVFEAQEAVYGELEFLMSQDLVNALYNAKGITQFYAHQAEAINALHEGYNVVVATSTSSGKSLIYQLPVLHALEQDHNTRAMYIFPTKALAQDQRRSLKDMMGFMPGLEHVLVETFDGDTPMAERNLIRDEARIIFTNPDMLHITILPNEDKWRTFLKNLKYVVGRSTPFRST